LYSFGYFAAFEYLAISRSYGLGVALVVGYAVATWSRPSPPIVRGGLLALVALTSAYGLLLAAVLVFAAMVADRRSRTLALLLPPVVAAVIAVAVMRPPPDSTTTMPAVVGVSESRAKQTVRALAHAAAPIPVPARVFRETTLTDRLPQPWIWGLAILLAGLGSVAWAVRRTPGLLALWVSGLVALLGFGYVEFPGSIRHHGHLFVLFLLVVWWARSYAGQAMLRRLLPVVLALHAIGGVVAVGADVARPFSRSRDAALFLRNETEPIYADPDWAATP